MRAILSGLLFVSLALARPEGYTTKWDNIDLDEILHNDRILEKYVDCLLIDGPDEKCTPDGKELKGIIPDALKTDCSKCNEKQKAGVEKVIKFLIENKKPWFKKLAKKYDEDNVYMKKYKEEAKKHGITLDEQ